MKKQNKNKFQNDKERILELKTALEEAKKLLDQPHSTSQTRTFIQDVLARYDEDLKFATAGTYIDKDFPELNLEMLDD
jgi:hypothetical protein